MVILAFDAPDTGGQIFDDAVDRDRFGRQRQDVLAVRVFERETVLEPTGRAVKLLRTTCFNPPPRGEMRI